MREILLYGKIDKRQLKILGHCVRLPKLTHRFLTKHQKNTNKKYRLVDAGSFGFCTPFSLCERQVVVSQYIKSPHLEIKVD